MRKIRYFIMLALCAMGIMSCQDDLTTGSTGVNLDNAVQVDLNLTIPKSMQVEVTRADNSYSTIETLKLYIFDGNTFLRSQELSADNGDVESASSTDAGHYYTVKGVTLYEGTQTVYAIANAATRNYWDDPTDDLDAAAEQGKNAFLKTVYDIYYNLLNNNYLPTFTSEVIPLTGEGDITVSGTDVTEGTVKLKRPAAKIIFNIEESYTTATGNIITFTPQYYGVYNVAGRGYVLESTSDRGAIDDSYFYNTPNDQPIANLESGIYIPENIQTAATECSSYNAREAFDESQGTTAEDKVWIYAPQNATFIVIRGRYVETTAEGTLYRSADVSYTIHLGVWSNEDYTDFSVLRNYIYTYNMSVHGVDNIVVEAKAEEDSDEFQNGAEGNVVELGDGSELFDLDAHYEQVYVEYDLTSIANTIRSGSPNEDEIDNLIANNFILYVSSPMSSSTLTGQDLLKTPYLDDEDAEETSMDGIDYGWVQFYSQTNDGISTYTNTYGYDSYMLTAWQACKKMGQAVRALIDNPNSTPSVDGLRIESSGNNCYARFTVFVDEYFYTEDAEGNRVDWADFTRTDSRSLLIATDMQISPDGNSSYATARTYITQASIQTFYNTSSSEDTNALGVELYNEYGVMSEFAPSGITAGSSDYNGRANMLTNISGVRWSDIPFTHIGYTSANTDHEWSSLTANDKYEKAYLACLSRNRDLNKDGQITDDEVKWYLPARSQYLRMGIGARSLGNYQLYTGDKSAMTNNGYPRSYVGDGSLYYSNTQQGSDPWELYWAVEVGAYGSNSYDDNGAQIRCVRNLPSRNVVDTGVTSSMYDDEALAGPVYGEVKQLSSGNYIFDFNNRLDGSLYRATLQEGTYNTHYETDDAVALPEAFVVAKDYVKSGNLNQSFTVSNAWSSSTRDNPCANYYETSSDIGDWRVPNLSEITVMSTVASTIGISGDDVLCSTMFSNQNVRIGFRYNQSLVAAYSPGQQNWTGYVRCVRDATEAEIASVR